MARTAPHQATWSRERTRELISEGYDSNDA